MSINKMVTEFYFEEKVIAIVCLQDDEIVKYENITYVGCDEREMMWFKSIGANGALQGPTVGAIPKCNILYMKFDKYTDLMVEVSSLVK